MSYVTAHNVMLCILIIQKNLLFTFTNLSINGMNTHGKVISFGRFKKGNSRAVELCIIQIFHPIGSGVIDLNLR